MRYLQVSLLIFLSLSQSKGQIIGDWTGYLKCGDHQYQKLTANLDFISGNICGTFRYDWPDTFLIVSVTGSIDTTGKITISETASINKDGSATELIKHRTTIVFSATINPGMNGYVLEGTWINNNGINESAASPNELRLCKSGSFSLRRSKIIKELMTDEIVSKISNWRKRRANETDEVYQSRTSADSLQNQKNLYAAAFVKNLLRLKRINSEYDGQGNLKINIPGCEPFNLIVQPEEGNCLSKRLDDPSPPLTLKLLWNETTQLATVKQFCITIEVRQDQICIPCVDCLPKKYCYNAK